MRNVHARADVLYARPGPDSPIKLADFGLGKLLDLHGLDNDQAIYIYIYI